MIRVLVGLFLIIGCSTQRPEDQRAYVDSLLKNESVQTVDDSLLQIMTAHREGKISADEAATAIRAIAVAHKGLNIELPADIRAALMRQQADTSKPSD